jgi:heat shock protein HtpX
LHLQIIIVDNLMIFFAQVIGHTIDTKNFRNERGCGIGFYIATFITGSAMGVLASIFVMQFSCCRGYRENVASLTLTSRSFMISALKRLSSE